MLDRCDALCKDSFHTGLYENRRPRRFEHAPKIFQARPGQEGQGERQRKDRVAEDGAPDGRPGAPSGVAGDQGEAFPAGADLKGGRLDYIRLDSEAVFENGGHDPGIGVEPEVQDGPPADVAGQIHSFGDGHVRQPPHQVEVRRPANGRVDTDVRREPGEVPPEERGHEAERIAARGPRVSGQRPAHRVELARGPVPEDLQEKLDRDVCPAKEPEALTLGAHPSIFYSS